MQITFAGLEIGNDAGGKTISDYSPALVILTSRANYIGAAKAQGFARGNRGVELGFRVSRAEATAAAAFALGIAHPASLAASGVLLLQVGATAYQCDAAILEGCRPVETLGSRVTFEFRFFCATLAAVVAAGADTIRDRDFRLGEATAGTIFGAVPQYQTTGDLDTIQDA